MNCYTSILLNGQVYVAESQIGYYSRIKDTEIACFVRVDSNLCTSLHFYLANDKEVVVIIDSMKGKGQNAKIVIPQDAPMFIKYPDDRVPLTDIEVEHLILMIDVFAREADLNIFVE